MNATEHFRAGHLSEAIQALTEEVRQAPGDAQKRTFLFELLCFAGEYDRAERQLDVLTGENRNVQMGALLYRAALAAERVRFGFFNDKKYLQHPAATDALPGTLNGQPFQTVADADERIGARLEIYAGGDYLWIPFEQIASIKMQPPKRLRDLLWAPVLLQTGPECKHQDLGEVFVPVIYPGSARQEDENVRLGRATTWAEQDDMALPFGQKLLLVDGEEIPFLELRELTISQVSGVRSQVSGAT